MYVHICICITINLVNVSIYFQLESLINQNNEQIDPLNVLRTQHDCAIIYKVLIVGKMKL